MQKSVNLRKTQIVTKSQVAKMIKASSSKQWNKKYLLTNVGTPGSSQSVDSTGIITALTSVAQGTTQQTRVGNYALAKRIFANITAYADSTDVQNKIRAILFSWTDANAPSISDVLVSASAYHTCFYNLNNIENAKLRILQDKMLAVNYSGTGPKTLHLDMPVDLKLQWASTSSASPVVNGLYILFVSDSSIATHPYVQCSFAVVIDNE